MREYEQPSHQERELTRDYHYEFHGPWTPGGLCRIRTFEHPSLVPVVVASELPENDNTSITNMASVFTLSISEEAWADPNMTWRFMPLIRHVARLLAPRA